MVDQIYVGDARSMDRVRPSSVALVVTSPPYFAGKAYEAELGEGHIPATYVEYLTMLEDVFAECVEKLEAGGRIAVNVANLGRKPYRSLSADVIGILQDRLGLLLRGEVIWRKARGAGANCAWGSFKKPANPVLRDLTERVVIASKGRFDRARTGPARVKEGLPSVATTTADEFMDATLDVWELAPESATRVGHPAPFPVELPMRLIDLYTYEGDVVLDPFMGSGTTAVAAVRAGRHYLGYDTDDALREGGARAGRGRGGAGAGQPGPAAARQGGRGRRRGAPTPPASRSPTRRPPSAGASPAGSSVDWVAHGRGGRRVARHRGRREHRGAHRAAPLGRPLPHPRRSGRAHHRRAPRPRAHHRPPGPRLRAAGRGGGRARRHPRRCAWSSAPPAWPRASQAYAAGSQHEPVGELLPGL